MRRNAAQRIGHDVGEAKRIAKSEDEVETGKRGRRQPHREDQQQDRAADRQEERAQNRADRSETVVQRAADRCEESADQRARQHQRACQERVRSQGKLGKIGDHIAEADADDWQQHVGDQMQQHHRITQPSQANQRREGTTGRPSEEEKRSQADDQADHCENRRRCSHTTRNGGGNSHARLVQEHH